MQKGSQSRDCEPFKYSVGNLSQLKLVKLDEDPHYPN